MPYQDGSAAKKFRKVTRVLDCIPEIWYDYCYSVETNCVTLLWGYRGQWPTNEITLKEAEAKTETDLEELSMELTFGCGRV